MAKEERRQCACCQFLPEDLFLLALDASTTTSECVAAGRDSGPLMTPQQAWKRLLNGGHRHRLVDTHGHAHLERDDDNPMYKIENEHVTTMISLTCAVEPADWQACLDRAAQSPNGMAALGVHPWYLEDLPEDWRERLEVLLQSHNNCFVGEIGLCKMARFVRSYKDGKTAALALQRRVFAEQL